MEMKDYLNRLMLLQSTQKAILRTKKDQENLEKDIKQQESCVSDLEKRFESLHNERLAHQKRGDSLEVGIMTKKEENKKLRIQLNTTKNQKDYDAILNSIMSNEADISKWEDEELEELEHADALKKKEAELKAEIAEEKAKLEDIKEKVRESKKECDTEIEKLERKKTDLREQIDPSLLAKFDQISNSKQTEALVKVKNRICGGCFTRVPKQIENELMHCKKTVICHSCGRLLMLDKNSQPDF